MRTRWYTTTTTTTTTMTTTTAAISERTERAFARAFRALFDARDQLSAAEKRARRAEEDLLELAAVHGLEEAEFDLGERGLAELRAAPPALPRRAAAAAAAELGVPAEMLAEAVARHAGPRGGTVVVHPSASPRIEN